MNLKWQWGSKQSSTSPACSIYGYTNCRGAKPWFVFPKRADKCLCSRYLITAGISVLWSFPGRISSLRELTSGYNMRHLPSFSFTRNCSWHLQLEKNKNLAEPVPLTGTWPLPNYNVLYNTIYIAVTVMPIMHLRPWRFRRSQIRKKKWETEGPNYWEETDEPHQYHVPKSCPWEL